MFKDYDSIIVISSWGLPKYYREARYVLEIESEEGKRLVIPKPEKLEVKKYSSTAAIINILKEELGIDNVKLLILVQDNILLTRVVQDWYLYKNKEFSRRKLEDELFEILYNSNINAAKELGIGSPQEYKKIVRFVPGVVSYVNGARIYTWRGERVYDVLRGVTVLFIYEELEMLEGDRIAIMLDTTHGINYFVSALKEASLIAAELFALRRLSRVKKLTLYHYNSDPLPLQSCGVPSLKLHLLDKTIIVREGKLYTSYLIPLLRDLESTHRKSQRLKNFWQNTDWDKILYLLFLFSRGLLVWALRATLDINKVPNKKQLKASIEDVKVVFHEQKFLRKIDYRWGSTCPTMYVIVSFILFEILKNYAIKARKDNSIEEIWSYIKRLSEAFSKDLEGAGNSKLSKLKERIDYFLNLKNKFIYFSLDEVVKIAEKILVEPLREINTCEFERRIKDYLKEKKVFGWKEIKRDRLKVFLAPNDRAYLVVYDDTVLLIPSISSGVDKRNTYAHAGLVYGLDWFSIDIKSGYEPLLCLGDAKCLKNVVCVFS